MWMWHITHNYKLPPELTTKFRTINNPNDGNHQDEDFSKGTDVCLNIIIFLILYLFPNTDKFQVVLI
jgi:hypothetical protein